MNGVVATIGAFDGVHLGHRWLLHQIVERARQLGCRSAAITFHPHPDQVIYPDRALTFLTDLEEKQGLMREMGVDQVTVFEFTRELSMLRPDEFIDMIQARHPLQELWIGPDFALGRGRSGSALALAEIGRAEGFALHMVPPLRLAHESVSSTYIRSLLAEGEVGHANRLLGRDYSLCGEVVSGHQRGRQLGFPTANLQIPSQRAMPADGVYAARAAWDGRDALAVVNLGNRPTFGDDFRLLEAHLIDTSVDLYGQRLCIRFTQRLRGIMKFASIDELREQIAADRSAAIAALA